MSDERNIMPIIGMKENLFGYITKSTFGNEKIFHFCNQDGEDVPISIDDYQIFAVHDHFYSTDITSKTYSLIVIKAENTIYKLVTIGGYHFNKRNVLDCRFLSDDILITSKDLLSPFNENEKKCFHPISKLNYLDSPRCLIKTDKSFKFCPNLYYLFSIETFHFFIEILIEDNNKKRTFKYFIIDEFGRKIKEYNETEQIKLIWTNDDGCFTIFSIAPNDEYSSLFYTSDVDNTDNKDICKLCVFNVSKEYYAYTYSDYINELLERKEIAEKKNTYNLEYECIGDRYTPQIEEFIKIKDDLNKYNEIIVDKKYITDFEANIDQEGYKYNVGLKDILYDKEYLILSHNTGYCVFDHSTVLSIVDLRNQILLDTYDNKWFEPLINIYNYSNGLIGLRQFISHKEYDENYPDGYDEYEEKGSFRIYDLFGNNVGEIRDNIFYSPVKESGICQNCGVISLINFKFIIPPIYQYIEPLDEYLDIEKKNYNPNLLSHESKDIQEIENIEDFDNSVYATKYLDKNYYCSQVIYKGHVYIARLKTSNNGRTLCALYKDDEELIPLGNNEIKKVSDRYVLVRTSEQRRFSLYNNRGNKLSTGILDMESKNVYYVRYTKDFYVHLDDGLTCKITYNKVYFENGFKLLFDDKIVVEELLSEVKIMQYKKDDIVLLATCVNGNIGLLSLKNGWMINNSNLPKSSNIVPLFEQNEKYNNNYSYVIHHIVKTGDHLTKDEKNKITHGINRFKGNQFRRNKYDFKIICDKTDESYTIIPSELIEEYYKGIRDYYKSIGEYDKSIGEYNIINNIDVDFNEDDSTSSEIFKIFTDDGLVGFYSISSGWLIKPTNVSGIRDFKEYLVFNDSIVINKKGIGFESEELEFIIEENNVSVFKIKSSGKYIIINNDGEVSTHLKEIESNIYSANVYEDIDVESYYEGEILFNAKEITIKKETKYHNRYDDYDDHGYIWTDEDSWDAMTDGQYGDYPGSGWDPELMGF